MKTTTRQTKDALRSEVAEVLGAIGPHLLAASQRLHSERPETARAALRRMALVLRPYLPEARKAAGEDEAIAAMTEVSRLGLSPARRRELAEAARSALFNLQLAAEAEAEPVGAVGHLVSARVQIEAAIERVLAYARMVA